MSEFNEEQVRTEVREWLAANWDPSLSLQEWRNRLVDSGWGMADWPSEWHGRDLPARLVRLVEDEFAAAGAVGAARQGIRLLAAATLLEHGSDAHKAQFLRRILTGEDTWCQLFSEPGSGSDLAGATTRAELKGDKWIINGQKLWTTSAHHADWGLLLARTNLDVPKHEGMTYFVINMRQPGVEVQPLKQMNGHASFNQVFFTDAEVQRDHLVGELNKGWTVAMTTLAHERRRTDGARATAGQEGGPVRQGRIYEEEAAESATLLEPYKWYPQRAGRVDLALPRAVETGRIDDPVVRQELAKLLSLARATEWTAQRARAEQQRGQPPGPGGSLGKLAASHVARAAAHVHTIISGADALLSGDDSPHDGTIAEVLVSVPGGSIAGGTDEIQRNIIAERVLLMPKEARFDTGPFREVRRN